MADRLPLGLAWSRWHRHQGHHGQSSIGDLRCQLLLLHFRVLSGWRNRINRWRYKMCRYICGVDWRSSEGGKEEKDRKRRSYAILFNHVISFMLFWGGYVIMSYQILPVTIVGVLSLTVAYMVVCSGVSQCEFCWCRFSWGYPTTHHHPLSSISPASNTIGSKLKMKFLPTPGAANDFTLSTWCRYEPQNLHMFQSITITRTYQI